MVEKYVAKSELDSALEGLCKKYNVSYGEESKGFGRDLAELSDRLAADSSPAVHGHWIISCDGYYPYCSECTKEPPGKEMTDYCPNCGAKMDGEEGENNG